MTHVTVTPELLGTARHTIWHDADNAVGDGFKSQIAPSVFGFWQGHGREFVRFGKLLGLEGGAYATMPVLPELLNDAVEARANDIAGATCIEKIYAGADVHDLWHRFFVGQVRAVGGFAVDCLRLGSVKPIQDPNRHARGLLYAASLLDPRSPVVTIKPTPYDRFDPLAYTGMAESADLPDRWRLADDLRASAKLIRGGHAFRSDPAPLIDAVSDVMQVGVFR